MKMNRNMVALVAVVLAGSFMAAPLAMAKEQGGREGRGEWKEKMKKHREDMDKELGLSEQQQKQMKALREEYRGINKKLREDMKTKQEALRALLDSDAPDRGQAEAIINEITAMHKQMMLNRVDDVLKVREILTPEQFQKLSGMREKHMKEMKGKMKGEMKEGWGGKHRQEQLSEDME